MKVAALVLCLCLPACSATSVYVGPGIHDRSIDGDNIDEGAIIGTVTVIHPINDYDAIIFQHDSALLSADGDGGDYGLNKLGLWIKIK